MLREPARELLRFAQTPPLSSPPRRCTHCSMGQALHAIYHLWHMDPDRIRRTLRAHLAQIARAAPS